MNLILITKQKIYLFIFFVFCFLFFIFYFLFFIFYFLFFVFYFLFFILYYDGAADPALVARYHLFALVYLRICNVVLYIYAVATEAFHAEPEDVYGHRLTDAVAARHRLPNHAHCGPNR